VRAFFRALPALGVLLVIAWWFFPHRPPEFRSWENFLAMLEISVAISAVGSVFIFVFVTAGILRWEANRPNVGPHVLGIMFSILTFGGALAETVWWNGLPEWVKALQIVGCIVALVVVIVGVVRCKRI
jgi:drug/metabolite transporter (DMT)-like permease